MAEPFKVLTYNIQRGLSAVKKREILRQIVLALELSRADVVCLQEVWREDGVNAHQLEALCRASWRHQLWRPNAVFPTGSQGNAVLSRFGVSAWHHVDLSIGGHEPRGLLHVALHTAAGAPLAVLCTHFGLRAGERRCQALALQRYIDRCIDPAAAVVLAGDFNDWRGRPEAITAPEQGFREVIRETTGRFGLTFPSFLPLLPLDRIYYRNLSLKGAAVIKRLPPVTTLSDHLPIEAVFCQ